MDISGIAAVDVFIGLAFIYFLLSTVCSAINEAIATSLNWRAKDLENGIRNLLTDTPPPSSGDDPGSRSESGGEDQASTDDQAETPTPPDADTTSQIESTPQTGTQAFYDDERVKTFFKPKRFLGNVPFLGSKLDDKKPSYIPPRVFALTLLDTYAPAAPGEDRADLVERARNAVATDLPQTNPRVATLLQDALDEAHKVGEKRVETFQLALEQAFNETMDRVGGWYKRRSQLAIFVIAVVLVGAMNADSFAIGQRLFKDDALRASVVAQATRAVDEGTADCIKVTPAASVTETPVPAPTPTPSEIAANCLGQIRQLGIPLGWSTETTPSDWAILGKIAGLLITAFAVLLGAPFWFDLLGKVARLRGAGPAPPSTTP